MASSAQNSMSLLETAPTWVLHIRRTSSSYQSVVTIHPVDFIWSSKRQLGHGKGLGLGVGEEKVSTKDFSQEKKPIWSVHNNFSRWYLTATWCSTWGFTTSALFTMTAPNVHYYEARLTCEIQLERQTCNSLYIIFRILLWSVSKESYRFLHMIKSN